MEDRTLDDFIEVEGVGEDSVECPTCGRSDFASEQGLKAHHTRSHDQPLTPGTADVPLTPIPAEWLQEQYWEQEQSCSEIAEKIGVAPDAVRRWMEHYEIERRDRHAARTEGDIEPLRDAGWLEEQYWQNDRNASEIGEELGVTAKAVRSWMKRHGIERRDRHNARAHGTIEPLKDAEWLRKEYWEKGRTGGEIADEVGVAANTVRSWMDRHGIERRSGSDVVTDGNIALLNDADWLHEQYCVQERSAPDIAEECGVHSGTVYTYLEKQGIERRSIIEARTDEGNLDLLEDEEWLREQYWEEGATIAEIADICDASANAVTNWMDRHGIERRGNVEARTDGKVELLEDEEWLRKQYCEQERSTLDIADECEVGISTVQRHMDEHGIDRRTIAEAKTEGDIEKLKDGAWLRQQHIENGRTAQEIAKECGVSHNTVVSWFERHGIEQQTHVYYADPGHLDHPVKSSWEKEIAELLIDLGVDYEYEGLEIRCPGDRTYFPDFVTQLYVIEVKGRVYEHGIVNAEAALEQLEEREYVVMGSESAVKQLPADHHFEWSERYRITQLFD